MGLYSPLVFVSYAVEYRFAGLNPFVFHLDNLLFHAANSLLVMWLVLRLSKNGWAAAFCAALFAVHPMHVESAAWITERKDMLYAFFYLAAVLGYDFYLESASRTGYVVSIAAFSLSLLSKPSGVLLPAALFLVDYIRERKFSRSAILDKLPHILLAVGFFSAYLFYSHESLSASEKIFPASLWQKICFASYGFCFYALKVVLPSGLSAVYPYPAPGILPPVFSVSVFGAAGILVAGCFFARKSRDAAFGLLFFAVNILPFLQFMRTGQGIVSDRYSYISYIGFFYIAGVYLGKLLQTPARKYAAAFAAAVLIAFSLAARSRAAVWRDSRTLWLDVLSKEPASQSAPHNLAAAYFAEGNFAEAVSLYSAGIAAEPENPKIYANRGAAYFAMGSFSAAEKDFLAAIKLNPKAWDVYYNLGLSAVSRKDFPAAENYFLSAVRLNEEAAPALAALGNLALIRNQKPLALSYCRRAVAASPAYAPALVNLAILALEENDRETAREYLNKALKSEPAMPKALILKKRLETCRSQAAGL